ncbi:MAG: polysaccharide deacetylase family protein [Bacteroidales bacterium]|nr:polysaccharide deacetylase family protein [Bacteroidales bacterium]
MEAPRHILSRISSLFPLKPMISFSGQKLIFPVYHAASENPPAHLKYLYRIRSPKEFEKDLDEICRFFEPLSPEILRAPGKLRRQKKPGFILSFDDGLREIKEQVEPILTRKGISAIFFLNNAFIDNKALFFRYKASVLADIIMNQSSDSIPEAEIIHILGLGKFEKERVVREILTISYLHSSKLDAIAEICNFDISDYLHTKRPYLETGEIIELQNKGFHIGAHSYDHPVFTDLNEEQMKFEITASIEDLVLRFNPPMRLFAFPFTDGGISHRVIESAFGNKLDAIFGTAGIKKEKQSAHYQRIPVEKSASSLTNVLKTEYLYYLLKAPFGRNTLKR